MKSERTIGALSLVLTLFIVFSSICTLGIYILHSSNVTSYQDILLVEVGNDSAISTASNIVQENIHKHVEEYLTQKEEEVKTQRKILAPMRQVYSTSTIEDIKASRKLILRTLKTDVTKLGTKLANKRASVLVVVGHGTQEGLEDSKTGISWEQVATDIENVGAKIPILLACYSQNIQNYMKHAVGMKGVVDAKLGAITVSALIGAALGVDQACITELIGQFTTTLALLKDNPETIQPLISWYKVRSTARTIISRTPAPASYWTNDATALKIGLLIFNTILLILLDNLSATPAQRLGTMTTIIGTVGVLVGLIGELTGLKYQFKVTVLWTTIDLWPLIEIAVVALTILLLTSWFFPLLGLFSILTGIGIRTILVGLAAFFLSTTSYNSIFTKVARVIGNTVGDFLLPLIVGIIRLVGISLSSSAQRIIRTCVYLLCTVLIISAVDKVFDTVIQLDVSKSWLTAIHRTLTVWSISCWIVDWAFYLGGR
ncbi:MAG: hypothetical protein ACFFDI_08500 [Promethearchaeota archaeon]